MENNKNDNIKKIAYAGLMAALCFVGYSVFPAISASGTKVHIGNAFLYWELCFSADCMADSQVPSVCRWQTYSEDMPQVLPEHSSANL